MTLIDDAKVGYNCNRHFSSLEYLCPTDVSFSNVI